MGEFLRAPAERQPPLRVRVGLGAGRRRRRVAARRRRRDEERRREQRRRRRRPEETDFVERDAALSGAEREEGSSAARGRTAQKRGREAATASEEGSTTRAEEAIDAGETSEREERATRTSIVKGMVGSRA